MQAQATQKSAAPSKATPFFSVQAQREPSFFSPSPMQIAAQADMDEAEQLAESTPMDSSLSETRMEEPRVQARMTMGAPGDAYEREADAMADQVVQRKFAAPSMGGATPEVQAKCSACQEEDHAIRRQPDSGKTCEEMLQAKSDGSMDVPTSVQSTIEGGVGGGAPMQESVRGEMESAFQTDFSQVRIHTGSTADGLNEDLSAQAFTYGKDIYFSAGEYQPGTPSGQHLLAHELTHVVQQNPGLQRKPRPQPGPQASLSSAPARTVQANFLDLWSFGPPSGKFFPGTKIHNDVLPKFAAANPDMFIEVAIPGANKTDPDTGRRGIADMYKADVAMGDPDRKSRTIGINFDGEGPTYLTHSGRMEGGGKGYVHKEHSAPRGGKHKPRVRGLNQASPRIHLGDLKPGNSAETVLGHSQLSSYSTGITNTRDSINDWLAKPENSGQAEGSKKSWTTSATALTPTSLKIPDDLDLRGAGKGIYPMPLAVYKNGKMTDQISGLKGAMYVYPAHVDGIWAYEWLPTTYPNLVDSDQIGHTLNRLETEVIEPVKSTGQAISTLRKKPRVRAKPRIRRKDKGFPYESWSRKYAAWKLEAEERLAMPGVEKQEHVSDALLAADKRTAGKVKLPAKVKERATGFSKIRHWMKYGRIYGWLRNTFDAIYVKVKKFADKIKKKVKNLLKRAGSTSFGSWVKAAIKVVFKIFKMVAAWTITQVVDKLLASLQQGITNNINKLLESLGVNDAIEKFEQKKAEYEAIVKEQEEAIEKKLFGDKLDLMDKFEKWEWIADKVGTIATLVEWGVRLLACAAPPALGCLWNLVISALQAAFAMLMQTCWFTKKVYAPVMNAIEDVREFPATVAKFVVDKANEYIPLPEGMLPLFAEITIHHGDMEVDCKESGDGGADLTPEQQAMLDLVQEMGVAKFCALLALMKKRGAGPWVLMTSERLAELKDAMKNVTVEQLKAAAEAPDSKVPEQMDKFLESVSKYTKREKQLIQDAADKKARDAAAKGGADGKGTEGKGAEGKGADGKGADGKGGGGKGDGAEADYKKPIDKEPGGRTKNTVYRQFIVATFLPTPLKPGGSFPKETDIYVIIVVVGDSSRGSAKVYPVHVTVKSVTAQGVEFINANQFFAYYTDTNWIEIGKGELIAVPYDRLVNQE